MLEIISKIFEAIILMLGGATFIVLVMSFVEWLCIKIEDIMHRQSKIRCLCKHEYIKDWTFQIGSYTEYALKCRKCGKVKKITICDDK